MAIQRLRDRSQGVLAKIIVGAIVVVFALFGFGSITTFLQPVPQVATVNGEEITEQEMLIALDRKRQMMMANAGTRQLDIDEQELSRTTLDELIERHLLTQATENLELFYSDQRVDQDILDTPAFQVDGQFNQAQYQLMLRGVRYTPMTYKEAIKTESMFSQINRGLAATSFMTNDEVERFASLAQQTRDIAYLHLEVDKLKEGLQIDEQAIVEYYQGNQQSFVNEETVDLEYVELRKRDLAELVEYEESELSLLYEEEKANYTTDEERRFAHILIEDSDDLSDDEQLIRANEIHERVASGEAFDVVASEVSGDPGSASSGGDLGFTQRGTFVPEFEEAAYALELDQVSRPTKSEFGYHIIKLLEVSDGSVPSFEELRDRLDEALRSQKAEETFVEKSARLSELAYESSDLSMPAGELGLEIKSTGSFGRLSGSGLTARSQVIDVAFSDDLLVDRNNSELIEIDADHHLVVRVNAHQPSEVRPLEEARDEIHDLLVLEAARERVLEQSQEIVTMLESGAITRYVADQFGLEWKVFADINRNQPGLDPQIAEQAFQLPRPGEGGKTVGSTVLSNGDGVVISVTKVANGDVASLASDELTNLARILGTQLGQVDYAEFVAGLRQSAEVERN